MGNKKARRNLGGTGAFRTWEEGNGQDFMQLNHLVLGGLV